MSMKTAFAKNQDAVTEGVWNDFGDFRVKLAYAGSSNVTYRDAMRRRLKPIQRQLSRLSDERANEILIEMFATHLIKGWQTRVAGHWKDGLDYEHGVLLPLTVENLCMVLTELPDLFQSLQECAQDQSAYCEEQLEEAAKN